VEERSREAIPGGRGIGSGNDSHPHSHTHSTFHR
jgi:hypothetical protein